MDILSELSTLRPVPLLPVTDRLYQEELSAYQLYLRSLEDLQSLGRGSKRSLTQEEPLDLRVSKKSKIEPSDQCSAADVLDALAMSWIDKAIKNPIKSSVQEISGDQSIDPVPSHHESKVDLVPEPVVFLERKYQCDKCSKIFARKKGLNAHLLLHRRKEGLAEPKEVVKPKEYTCQKCEASIDTKLLFTVHALMQCPEENDLPCPLCKGVLPKGSSSRTLGRIRSHFEAQHPAYYAEVSSNL